MVRVATPVCHLFRDAATALSIVSVSDCLEGRDHYGIWTSQERLFHFEASIVNVWDFSDRMWVERIISERNDLELVSFHIASCCSHPVLQGIMFLPGGETFSRERLLENGAENLRWLKQLLKDRPAQIALENNNYYPTEAYSHVTEPSFIHQLVDDNDVLFLFDLAHAHISTHNMGCPYLDYVGRLPLERTVQLHVSQWAVDDHGMAFDSHDLPGQALNHEACSLVNQYGVEFITIEYYKDSGKLVSLLENYRVMLGLGGVWVRNS